MQGATQLARKGRSRKRGYREPNGRLDRKTEEPTESSMVIALRQPHRRDAPATHADDSRAETPLGVLNIIGAISSAEYAAARRYARIVNRYRQVINSPNPSPPSIAGAFEPKYGGGEISDPRERKADYDAAFEALSNAGQTAAKAVAHMAVYGQACPVNTFGHVIRGLRILREHFELQDRAKSDNRQKFNVE